MTRTGAVPRPAFDARSDSFFDAARAHWRKGAIGVAAVAVVGAGLAFYRWNDANRDQRAEQALAQAQRSLVAGNAPLAQRDLGSMVKQYEGTPASVQGTLLLAQLLYDQGKPADGLKLLQGVADDGGAEGLRASVHALIAAGHEQQGKPADAAAEYLRAAQAATFDRDRASYRADAARAYMAAGNKEAARAIWTELSADPRGPLAGEARVRLGELSAAPATKS